MVGEEGVEPSMISPVDFESTAYASSATRPRNMERARRVVEAPVVRCPTRSICVMGAALTPHPPSCSAGLSRQSIAIDYPAPYGWVQAMEPVGITTSSRCPGSRPPPR